MNAQRYRPFVGIDENSEADPESDLPGAFRQTLKMMNGGTAAPTGTMKDVIRALPKAEPTPVYYHDDERGEYVQIKRNVAVVNPEWMGDGLEAGPQDTAAWNVPTDSYEIVNPMDVWGPLMATSRSVLNDREDAGKYRSPDVFGMAREYRNGGEVHMDVFFPSYAVKFGDESDDAAGETAARYVLGITTGKDYFRNQTLYATPIALDTGTGGVMRHLDEPRRRRHRKAKGDDEGNSASETAGWYGEMIHRLDTVSETLYRVINDARRYSIPFGELPYSPADFFVSNGIPESVAEKAVEEHLPLGSRSASNPTVSAWELYRALTTTLADGFTSKTDGQAIKGHIRVANRILSTPGEAESSALVAARRELADEGPEVADEHRETLDERRETTAEAVETYGTIRERLKSMYEESEANDEADEQNDETDHEGQEVSA